jgi:hypothetical protein
MWMFQHLMATVAMRAFKMPSEQLGVLMTVSQDATTLLQRSFMRSNSNI